LAVQSLAASCCQLLRPSLDKGVAECRATLSLPQRKFKLMEQYTINACIEECRFMDRGFIPIDPPFELDMSNIRTSLEATMPAPQEEAVSFMLSAFTKCAKFYEKHKTRFSSQLPAVDFIEEECNVFPLHLTICMRVHGMQKCPKTFYADTSECDMARKYFTQCVGDIEAGAQ
ncbi:Obp85a, partial [Drosophila busckii]